MRSKIHKYEGAAATVTYDVNRCIHAAECVRRLPAVFDPEGRPWIRPDNADPDSLADTVLACPTGALQMSRGDGQPVERSREPRTVTVAPDGPLYLRGNVEMKLAGGEQSVCETRIALCRCGASANKPLCDGSHSEAGFRDSGRIGDLEDEQSPGSSPDDVLAVSPAPNGPLLLKGTFELRGANGAGGALRTQEALCRCGASNNKPFCDGSHKKIGFEAD